MVRYSKLPFRHLVSLYDVHITHTPMMMAAEFSRSAIARHSDFTTSSEERGHFSLMEKGAGGRVRHVRGSLVAQFAANDPKAFADACELIQPHVDGVDLNCGCPQPWAYSEHVGSWLLRQPDRVRDLVRAAKDRLGWGFSVSIKVRVDSDLKSFMTGYRIYSKRTHCIGASYITVHGRTRQQASTLPVNLPAISFARECVKGSLPVVANGDAWSTAENETIRRETGCESVMSARGLLANPALFSGYTSTPASVVQQFVRLGTDYGLVFTLFHRHIAYMLESRFPSKSERTLFSSLTSHASIVDYLESRGIVCF
ncbi:tRNA-dihydrouridine synthase-like protein [Rhizoctonia solani AG-3 Rhs1AP]|uniref:tRNA-dihydrouridine synthase n=1 Tax=Rhizoctonia solani AG-3 Rhs1AP TaxID=1086054 RepID=X8J5H9_9AGAM|nr:tRNA-dihydrouridine synthase-like protein [Rhizoctonia solani AG-3 Rhs1AP]